MLLEAWVEHEKEYGSEEEEEKVSRLLPRKVTKRRQITTEDGTQTRWEEYVDYVFPDDQAAKPSLLLLAKAKEWAKQRQEDGEEAREKDEGISTTNVDANAGLDKDDSDVDVGTSGSDSDEDEQENITTRKKNS